MSENLTLAWTTTGTCHDTYSVRAVDPNGVADPSSPYPLNASGASYSATVASAGSKSWAIGLHTFTVYDVSTAASTSVVKTCKV